MFELPASWPEVQNLLAAIQRFCDRQPMIYTRDAQGAVIELDFPDLCARMPASLEQFLRTGEGATWPVPVEIYGGHADWVLLTCGLLPHRPHDFVIRWNVRAMAQPPSWALNRPSMAVFFPGLVLVKNGHGQLDTFVWQQIWQPALATFKLCRTDQLLELRAFCDQEFANTSWGFRDEHLIASLEPKTSSPPVEPVTPMKVDGELQMAVKSIMCHTGHGAEATFFCMACSKLYCLNCSQKTEHVEHTFKSIIFQ
jgi:hypothetical protein